MRHPIFLVLSLLVSTPVLAYPDDPAEHTRLVRAADRDILPARQALLRAESTVPIDEADVATKLDAYAWLCVLQSRLARRAPLNIEVLSDLRDRKKEAKSALQRALTIRERLFGRDSAQTQETLAHFGYHLTDVGEFPAAETYLVRAIQIGVPSGGSPAARAEAMKALAEIRESDNKLEEAIALRLKALDVESRLAGPRDWRFETSIEQLAINYANLDKFTEAEKHFATFLEVLEKNPESDPYDVQRTLNNLAATQLDQYNYQKVEGSLVRASNIGKQLSPQAPELERTRQMLDEIAQQKKAARK